MYRHKRYDFNKWWSRQSQTINQVKLVYEHNASNNALKLELVDSVDAVASLTTQSTLQFLCEHSTDQNELFAKYLTLFRICHLSSATRIHFRSTSFRFYERNDDDDTFFYNITRFFLFIYRLKMFSFMMIFTTILLVLAVNIQCECDLVVVLSVKNRDKEHFNANWKKYCSRLE